MKMNQFTQVIIFSLICLTNLSAKKPSVSLERAIFLQDSKKDYEAALTAFDIALDGFSDDEHDTEIFYRKAMCAEQLGNNEERINLLRHLAESNGRDKWCEKARAIINTPVLKRALDKELLTQKTKVTEAKKKLDYFKKSEIASLEYVEVNKSFLREKAIYEGMQKRHLKLVKNSDTPSKRAEELKSTILVAMEKGDLNLFHSVCNSTMKNALTKASFTSLHKQVKPFLKKGYSVEFRKSNKRSALYETYVWDLNCEDNKKLTLTISFDNDEKVAGCFVK